MGLWNGAPLAVPVTPVLTPTSGGLDLGRCCSDVRESCFLKENTKRNPDFEKALTHSKQPIVAATSLGTQLIFELILKSV